MAQSGYTPILLYASGTATNVPLAANMTSSSSGAELALNYADGKLYYKNSSGVVTLLVGTGGAGVVAGSNTQVQFNNSGVFGASANFTWSGSALALGSSILFQGDFSNATVASRTAFQTSTTNGSTGIYALPNGTSTAASWQATNNATATNASKIIIATNGTTDVQLVSGINGSGTYLPLTFWNNGAEKMRLNVNGNFGIGDTNPAVKFTIVGTDAILIPAGTTAQQPTGVAGYLRFNTTTTQFEGYNGTTWASVGGAAISNDTSTASFEYPIFASATSGTALTVYTSNAKYLYKPSTGELQASELIAGNGLVLNNTTVATSYTIATGNNAMSVGPVTIATGQSVTVSSGQRWLVF